ncbi:MAG: DMT family transporter [Alphaproteobacteria bacterium]
MTHQKTQTTLAIFLFVAVLAGNAVIFAIVPHLTQDLGYSAFQIMLCYSAIATFCMLPWAFRQGIAGLKTTRLPAYSLRALLEYGSFTLSFYSLSYLGDYFTLPMHTALNFMTPLLATVVAILVLREKSHFHTWLALLIGFAGVLAITRPGMIPLSPGVLYVLGAAAGFSGTGVVIKLLCRSESSRHIAFYMLAMTTVLALPAGIAHWKAPSPEGWVWLVMIGVIAYLQQVSIASAIARVPYTMLIPLNFTTLIFSTILSYFFYHKLIDGWTLAGALIILAGTIYNTQRSRAIAAREAIIATV